MTAMIVGLTRSTRARSTSCAPMAAATGRDHAAGAARARSLPALLGGLRVAAPNAVLGAILAEFGGGGRWGLGVYLLGSLGRADPARLWGIGLAATAIAGLAYWIFALHRQAHCGSVASRHHFAGRRLARCRRRIQAAQACHHYRLAACPFVLWWALLALLGVPGMIAKTPWGSSTICFCRRGRRWRRRSCWTAVAQTLPMTIVGMAVGLSFAFMLALCSQIRPGLVNFSGSN